MSLVRPSRFYIISGVIAAAAMLTCKSTDPKTNQTLQATGDSGAQTFNYLAEYQPSIVARQPVIATWLDWVLGNQVTFPPNHKPLNYWERLNSELFETHGDRLTLKECRFTVRILPIVDPTKTNNPADSEPFSMSFRLDVRGAPYLLKAFVALSELGFYTKSYFDIKDPNDPFALLRAASIAGMGATPIDSNQNVQINPNMSALESIRMRFQIKKYLCLRKIISGLTRLNRRFALCL